MDDGVIKRRLLIDGDGTGDDRRLNILLKTFLKWCLTKNDSPENNQIVYDRLLALLAQCSFVAEKSCHIQKMIDQELQNYETLSRSIESSIELARREIEISKQELILAKKIRKNRVEYDVLAKVINTQPDRKKTTQQLEILKRELTDLQDEKLRLEKKLNFRKNDFYVLMRSIKELQSKLDGYSDEEGDNDSLEEMDLNETDLRNMLNATKKDDQKLIKEKESRMIIPRRMSADDDAILEINVEKDRDVLKLDEAAMS